MEENQMNVQIRRWGQGVGFYLFVSVFCILTVSPAALFANSIVGWGWNDSGQATPPDGNNFIAIAAGGAHSLALKSDGSIVTWGGQTKVPDGNNFIAIAAGKGHSLALKSDGSIVAWGENCPGQATPPDGNNLIAIAAGGGHSLALRSGGGPPLCQYVLAGDLNNDCKVDMLDFVIMANNWLVDCYADPNNPSCVPK